MVNRASKLFLFVDERCKDTTKNVPKQENTGFYYRKSQYMLNVYPTYKDSGIEWLGQIPTHWELTRISSVLTEVKDLNTSLRFSHPSQFKFGDIILKPDVNIEDVSSLSKCIIFRKDDILINGLNLNYDFVTQRIARANYTGIITSAYIAVRVRNNLSSKYVTYLFKALDSRKVFNGLGTGIRLTLTYKELKKYYILLPPQEEQRQIVAYLDYKSNKINERICQRERELQTLSELKQAEIATVVTRGLDPNVPMKESGIEWIGQIPAHWEIKYLSQIAEEHYISNKDVHHQNLLSLSYGRIVRKDINTTEGLLPASFDTYQVIEKGNIILRLTDLQNDHKSLRIGLVTEEGIITSAYICIQSRRAVLPEYLYLLLHSYDICKVFYGMGGGLRQSLSYADIKRIPIIIPAISEQVEIIKHINAKTKNILSSTYKCNFLGADNKQ